MGEKAKPRGLYMAKEGEGWNWRLDRVRNRWLRGACVTLLALVMSWPRLLPTAMSGSVVQLQLGSASMPVARDTLKSHLDIHGPSHHQGPRGYLRTVLPPEAMVTSKSTLLPEAKSGSIVLSQLASVLISQGPVTTACSCPWSGELAPPCKAEGLGRAGPAAQ